MLPDRSVLIGQKLVENAKIQMWLVGWFSNTVLLALIIWKVSNFLWFSGFDLSNIATLITTAFYQPPQNANAPPMTRVRRVVHLLILYYLPLVIYVPTGLLCAWVANESIGFGPFESYGDSEFLLIQILATSFCLAPFVYLLLSLVYYGVSVFCALQTCSRYFRKVSRYRYF